MIRDIDFLVIGAGPAGLSAARAAVEQGIQTVVVDDAIEPGGQLVKQTHKFFGSEMEYAGVRGIAIPEIFLSKLRDSNLFELHMETPAIGIYDDNVVTVLKDREKVVKYRPKAVLVATGAREKMIPFPGNDLPGVYGAGAVQTLMNVYGVKPGNSVLMVGAGNIGLIVSYQLMQAGVNVAAVIEGMDHVGGFWVHSAKIKRLGIPVLTRHTILEAWGEKGVEGARICAIDDNWNKIEGSEQELAVDTICLAVGLSPLSDFFYQTGCEMKWDRELSGDVPVRDKYLETTRKGIFVAGDAGGIEEASSAMIEGFMAGLSAARHCGADIPEFDQTIDLYRAELDSLRSGEVGEHIRKGLAGVTR